MDQPISDAVLRRAARHFHGSQCDPGVLERADLASFKTALLPVLICGSCLSNHSFLKTVIGNINNY